VLLDRLFRRKAAASAGPSIPEAADPSHRATLDRLMSAGGSRSPRDLFSGVSDDFWLWAFTEGWRGDERLRELLPALPPDDEQRRYTGAAGDDTIREAFAFYTLVRAITARHLGRPLDSVVEFGCGWGRIIRLFLRDIEPGRLWGIDCMPGAIDLCTTTNRYCRFVLVDPFPPTPLTPGSADLVYAYSVFSHLSERAHLEWLAEFKRILKPGGLVVATTWPREYIWTCARARQGGERPLWARGPVFSFTNTKDALARYDRGEFLHEPIGGGDVLDASFFGETCIPRTYVVKHWTRLFDLVEYIDDRRRFLQNVIVVRRR
jgi:SAM-dependent methyltransferase